MTFRPKEPCKLKTMQQNTTHETKPEHTHTQRNTDFWDEVLEGSEQRCVGSAMTEIFLGEYLYQVSACIGMID